MNTVDRIVRMRELPGLVGHSRAGIYRKLADKSFPTPVRLGPNAVGWRMSEIQKYIASLERAA